MDQREQDAGAHEPQRAANASQDSGAARQGENAQQQESGDGGKKLRRAEVRKLRDDNAGGNSSHRNNQRLTHVNADCNVGRDSGEPTGTRGVESDVLR
jgi:hypothetical protein